MKKRNYVVAIGMIAVFIQSGACAMEGGGQLGRAGSWVKGKVTQAKAMTVDKLYDMAKDFKKDVKALRKCRKAGTCTPEQKRKVRVAGAAIGTAAVAVAAYALVGVGIGVASLNEPTIENAARKFGVDLSKKANFDLLVAARSQYKVQDALNQNPDPVALDAGIWLAKRLGHSVGAYDIEQKRGRFSGPRRELVELP